MRTAIAVLALLTLAGAARGELAPESAGRVETLAAPLGAHWVWVADPLLRRSALLDLDRGAFLGMISQGYLSPTAVFPRGREEFYLPETYYTRGSRGRRTDVVTVYDAATLAPVDEIEIPPRRAINVLPLANAALSDDDRFLAVFNMNPDTSLSIVDVERRRLSAEIATPGCALVYAAGERRFLMLCGDGSLLSVTIDDDGRERGKQRSEPFFDPLVDPVTEKAVRYGDTWLFASFEGYLHPVDVGGERPLPGHRWSLLDDADRRDAWRIGGSQHLAVHQGSGRLFSLVHQGGPDTHKEPGTELWVYDLARRERIQRIELLHPGLSFLTETLEFGEDWIWPFNRLFEWLLAALPHPGLTHVQVTQDEAPLLVTGTQIGGSLAVYDALSGRFLRRVAAGNLSTQVLQAPWGGAGRER